MKLIKHYKGHDIYKTEDGKYVYSYIKVNIVECYLCYSEEFESIRQCKNAIKTDGLYVRGTKQ